MFFSSKYPIIHAGLSSSPHKKKHMYLTEVAPDIDLNFCNWSQNSSIDIWVPKMHFPKIYISGAPIESTGPDMVSSPIIKSLLNSLNTRASLVCPSGARASGGLDKLLMNCLTSF